MNSPARRAGIVAGCALGAIAFGFVVRAVDLLESDAVSEALRHHGQVVRNAALAGRLQASGIWQLNDRSRTGKWRLSSMPTITSQGTWEVRLQVTQSTPGTINDDPLTETPPVELVAEVPLNESPQGRPVSFTRYSPTTDFSATALADADEGRTPPVSPAFAAVTWGRIHGVRLEGEFASPDGAPGTWSGWWHAWRSEIPGIGFSDSEAE